MANFAILRTGKLKSAASIRGMLRHNFRTIETPNADERLTPENEHMAAKSVNDGMRLYRERLPEKVRKNAVHAIDYMITTSPGSDRKDNAKTLDEAYSWLCERHGSENVIMASKHFDEKTPHAHFLVIPIDKKGKLNARNFIGGSKHRMSELQDEFFERLKSKNINIDRGIKGSRATHQRVKDHYTAIQQTGKKIPQISPAELKPQKLQGKNLIEKILGVMETDQGVASRINMKIRDAVTPMAENASVSSQNARRAQAMAETALGLEKEIQALRKPFRGLSVDQAGKVIKMAAEFQQENNRRKELERARLFEKIQSKRNRRERGFSR